MSRVDRSDVWSYKSPNHAVLPEVGLSIGRVWGIVVVGMHRGTAHVMTPTPVAHRSCSGIQISDTSYRDDFGTIRCVCVNFFFWLRAQVWENLVILSSYIYGVRTPVGQNFRIAKFSACLL